MPKMRTKLDNLKNLIGSPTTTEKLVVRTEGEKRKRVTDANTMSNARRRKLTYTADDMCAMRKGNNLSTRQTIRLAQDLRQVAGSRNSVEPHLRKKLYDQNHKLDDFFGHDNILFIEEDKKKKTTRKFRENVVVAKDIKSLIDQVLLERLLERAEALIRIGIDGGGGFLKICMSIFNLQAPVSSSSSGQ